jgi:uroporphyrinogen III methyltransferase/synthase
VAVYETLAERPPDEVIEQALDADIITFTSSSTVTNTLDLLDDTQRARLAAGPLVASIGPVTSDTAREAGLQVATEAGDHDIPGLMRAVLELAAQQR